MIEILDKLLEILKRLEPLILVLIPVAVGIYLKIKFKIQERMDIARRTAEKKAREQFNLWKQDESRRTILQFREICNKFRDITDADQTAFLQFSNGNIAVSGISNMYVTCETEDTRHSVIIKLLPRVQRVPYITLAYWVNAVFNESPLVIADIEERHPDWQKLQIFKDVKSQLAVAVCDKDQNKIGVAILSYKGKDFNGASLDKQKQAVQQFGGAIETIILSFYVACVDMLKKFGLESE